MKSLNKQLEKSIELAHLTLTDKEKNELSEDLDKILSFVEVIKKSSDVVEEKKEIESPAETNYPQLKKRNIWRDDSIEPFKEKVMLSAIVPAKKDNLIKVKKI